MLRCGEVLNSRKKLFCEFCFLPPFFRFDSSFFSLLHISSCRFCCLSVSLSGYRILFSPPRFSIVQFSRAYIAPFAARPHMCVYSQKFFLLRPSCCLLLVDHRSQVDDDDDFLSLSAPRSSDNSSREVCRVCVFKILKVSGWWIRSIGDSYIYFFELASNIHSSILFHCLYTSERSFLRLLRFHALKIISSLMSYVQVLYCSGLNEGSKSHLIFVLFCFSTDQILFYFTCHRW